MKFHSQAVREAARGRWVEVCGRLGIDTALLTPKHGRCPAQERCPGNDSKSGGGGSRRFRFDNQDGRGSWICSGQFAGDGLALVEHCLAVDWREATELVGEALGLKPTGRSNKEEKMSCEQRSKPVAPRPERRDARLPFDVAVLRRFFRPEWGIDRRWLQNRSPVKNPRELSSGEFLDALFAPAERILIFTDLRSQGDFLWEARGRGGFRLGDRAGIRAVRSGLPRESAEGVWYLCQPVTGQWRGNGAKLSRRSAGNVIRWPHLVLESDEAPEAEWLCFLAQLRLPVAAIYTSGGRSIHAVLKVDCATKAEWDAVRRVCLPVMSRLGADAGAITAVRLTRLPGTQRGKQTQELLYLDPAPTCEPILGR